MAISRDAINSGAGGQFSHTCTGASVLFIFCWDSGGGIIGAQWNGIPLTLLIDDTNTAQTGHLFVLADPPNGTGTVTLQGALSNNGAISASYKADNDGTLDSSATGNGTASSPITVTTTVVASNCWLVGFGNTFAAQNFTTTSNRSDWLHLFVAGTSGQESLLVCDSNGTVSTGSQSIAFSNGAASPIQSGIVISISPLLSTILKVSGVNRWQIKKISGVVRASIKKLSGVTNA